MRIHGLALASLLITAGLGVTSCGKGVKYVPDPKYACASPDPTNYPGITKHKEGDGHCLAEWDVSQVVEDAPGKPSHPEVELAVNDNVNQAAGPDEIVFSHKGHHKFHYDVKPNPPGNADESECFESPVLRDPNKNDHAEVHHLGRVHRNPSGPAECHYKFTFYLDDDNKVIDPHIVIGSGGTRVGGK